MQAIYLDHNSTTRIAPRVVESMVACWQEDYGNPASQHQPGQRAARRLEDARDAIRSLLGAADDDTLIFTSGATESNNLALLGLAGQPPARVLVSAVEHPSVAGPAARLRQRNFDVREIEVDSQGVIDLNHASQLLTDDTRLVSVMLANHETGVLQPVAELAALCNSRGIALQTDAVQAVGKLPVDFHALGVTALSLSGHKLHGPPGIGALLLRKGTPLEPQWFGGFQQLGLRPGTQSDVLAVGLQTAMEDWRLEQDERRRNLEQLRDRFEQKLRESGFELRINGLGAPRAPHTSNISFPGIDRQSLLIALDLAGVACSTGSACASGSSEPSPVLLAMGVPMVVRESALRFSLAASTTMPEIDEAVRRIVCAVNSLRERPGVRKTAAPSRQRHSKPL
jgi:cysteine desulfurase